MCLQFTQADSLNTRSTPAALSSRGASRDLDSRMRWNDTTAAYTGMASIPLQVRRVPIRFATVTGISGTTKCRQQPLRSPADRQPVACCRRWWPGVRK